jgi:hypothetical protein
MNNTAVSAGVSEARIRVSVSYAYPQADVTYLAAAASAQVVKSTDTVTVANAVATVAHVIPAAALQYISIVLDVLIDPIGRNPFINDIFAAADVARITTGKSFTEAQTTFDEITSILSSKGLAESVATYESHLFDIAKALESTVPTAEQLQFELANTKTDAAAMSDQPYFAWQKGFEDRLYYPTDGPNAYDTYALSYFLEDYVREYFPELHVFKGLAEFQTTVDVITSKVLGKSLVDGVQSTDDFFGSANPDDDETMFFFKALNDVASKTDSATLASTKSFSEVEATSDSKAVDYGKNLTEAKAAADTATSAFDKASAESVAQLDAASMYLGKALTDTATKADTDSRDFSKGRTDAVTSGDSIVELFGKNLSENEVTSDTKTFTYSKALSEAVQPTDDFLGVANPDDDETMLFNKAVSETINKSDTSSNLVAKAASDSASTSQSGLIQWTDYWDINYTVTTSGLYVGQSQTF